MDPLNITGKPMSDDRITKFEMHAYNPYANTSLENNDEIRIPIQQQDLVTLPSESYLYIEGKLVEGVKADDNPVTVKLDNNCVAYMFNEIRYELNGIEIDRCKNVGVTTSIKNLATLTSEESAALRNAGWSLNGYDLTLNKNNFSFSVPLRMLLGFCEDYKRVVVNARHELVLTRARDDIALITESGNVNKSRVQLGRIQWRMPHLTLNDMTKLQFLRYIEKGNMISVAFRTWDLYEYPLLPTAMKHVWTVKAATQLEKPRYVILALRTNKRAGTRDRVSVSFDNCYLSDVKLYLNSESYPYDRLNLNFEELRYSTLYDMYLNFIRSYYAGRKAAPMLSLQDFAIIGPIMPIDCSHQNDSIKSGTVDIRIEMECMQNIPHNTTAYCLIIHDRVIEYNPLNSIVRKLT